MLNATGNDVMKRLLPTIHESIQAGYHHTRRVEGSYQRASQCHLEMYRAIMEHDSARASGSPAAHDADDARLRRRGAVRAGEVRETFEALPRSPAGT
ncbi:MAG: FCD domain-containing protein [Christensenellales bacterium]